MKRKHINLLFLSTLLFSCNIDTNQSSSPLNEFSTPQESIEESSSITKDPVLEKKYVSLTELKPTQKQIGYCEPTYNKSCLGVDKFLLNGFLIKDGISVHPGQNEDVSLTYDISSFDYDTFVTTIGKNDPQANCRVEFKIYVNGYVKYSSGLVAHNFMDMVEIDIKNASTLTLVVSNGGDSHSFDCSTFAYPALINKNDLYVESIRAENLPYVVKANQDINDYDISAILKYNTGTFKRVNNDITISNFNQQQLGKQFVDVVYGNTSTKHEVYCCNENEYHSILDIQDKWIDYKTLNIVPTIGMDICDRTPFAIGGINYKDGIGMHPINDNDAAYIKIDISSFNCDRFHAVIGKTRTALRHEVMYYIYADDANLIYESSFMTPGKEETIDVSIAGVNTLTLVIDSGDDSIDYDSAGFANAFIYKK